ncbi:non-ribosomal peptide synthetase [Pseudoalteromonas sp. OF7H-1]|uniref:non-ribosomal peptide synthetase n=1 Tax=Pseudoalteromonas sp. OF7H-1 TaxID=2917755 RepID=UPI001EF71F4A|nr:non-ribosomal peptide synthetase [Pseudoalteromonas sp. OF7H-1]MCG7542547.1 non-ribosomal peptide synthetase [Pseudoalteromonas sp. OF7H-1]
MFDLIKRAVESGILLYVDEGELKYKQMGDEFPEDLKQSIRNEKKNLINHIIEQQSKNLGKVSLIEQFAKNVVKHPSRTALIFGDKVLSFSEMLKQVEHLACYILAHSNHKPVAIMMGRGVDTMIAIYAALRANVPYVPIDPANPNERVSYYLKNSSAELLITDVDVDASSKSIATPILFDDIMALEEFDKSVLPNISDIDEESIAYIIYTSGSTGKPKGVACSHKNLHYYENVMQQQYRLLNLTDCSNWLWNASFAFDASIKGVVSLAQGRSLVIPSDTDVKDPKSLVSLVRKFDVPVLNAPPIVMEYLLPHLIATQTYVNLIVSGDDISKALWAELFNYGILANRKVINAYGPTEATVNATLEVQTNDNEVSIGKAVDGAQLYIMDEKLQSSDSEGELYIAGDGVAIGYFNNDKATSEAFVELDIESKKVRAYKTGDLVKVLDDNRIKFLGRTDSQIKYRGYRISLGEIEGVLKDFTGIKEAVVLGNKSENDMRIEGYLVGESESPSIEAIYQYLSSKLPEYMHPTSLTYLDTLPLTSGGKVDKGMLLNSNTMPASMDLSVNNSIADRLTFIWKEVLRKESIELEHSFFELGGHSLLAMQLMQKIENEFGLVMDTRDLFTLLTLQSQIDWVTENIDSTAVTEGNSESKAEQLDQVELEI